MLSAKSVKNYFSLRLILIWLLLFVGLLFAGSILIHVPLIIDGVGVLLLNGKMGQVASLSDGTIEEWLVEEGDVLEAGDGIVVIRDAQNPHQRTTIRAKRREAVAEIIAHAGSHVSFLEPIAFTTGVGDRKRHLQVVGFVSSLDGKRIQPGMLARVEPSITSRYREGSISARVQRVGKLPATEGAIQALIKIPEVARYLRTQLKAEPFLVVLNLDEDVAQVSGYRWSGVGPNFELDSGIFVTLEIIYEKPRLLALVWPALDHILFMGR